MSFIKNNDFCWMVHWAMVVVWVAHGFQFFVFFFIVILFKSPCRFFSEQYTLVTPGFTWL